MDESPFADRSQRCLWFGEVGWNRKAEFSWESSQCRCL